MEPRFVIHSHYSEEEFVRYSTIQYKLLHLKRNIIVTNVALLAMIVPQFVVGQYYYGIAMLVILAVANWYFFIGIDRKAKQIYRKNPFIQENVTFDLTFHDGSSSPLFCVPAKLSMGYIVCVFPSLIMIVAFGRTSSIAS